jgi:hypothetical protein
MRRRSWIVAAVVAAAVSVSWADGRPPALDYAIKDQFGTLHTDEDCGAAVVMLLGGDRKGVAFIEEWGPRLHDALAIELDHGALCSVGFAHLKGVPFFVKKKVVDSFPKDLESWTMLDWKGHIAKSWGADKAAANFYLFDRTGSLVRRDGLREFDPDLLEEIVEATQTVVKEK